MCSSDLPRADQIAGIALISLAVLLVARGSAEASLGQPPGSPTRLPIAGVGLALGALLCGSLGALLSRAALLSAPVTPLQAATLRLAAASLALLPLMRGLPVGGLGPRPARRRWPRLLLATLLGTSAGIALQQQALAGLPGGLAVALMATAPVMALPLAWWLEGDRPGVQGLLAAGAALAGVSLLVVQPG